MWGRVDNCHLFVVVIYILFEIRIWICCVCHWYLRHIVFVFLVVFVFVACVQAGVWWGRVGFLSAGSICPQVRCSQARIKMIRISHRITMWSWCWWPPKVAKKDLQKKEMIGVSVAFMSYLMAIVDDFQVDEIVHCLPHLLSIPYDRQINLVFKEETMENISMGVLVFHINTWPDNRSLEPGDWTKTFQLEPND